jgi:hypothetical protein
VLAVAFLAAGVMKLTQPKEKLAASGMAWTEDFSPTTIKLIGLLEVAAAFALILPAILDAAVDLVPFAAIGLVLLMLGAAATHLRRGESQMVGVNALLIALALVVVWGRLSAHPF